MASQVKLPQLSLVGHETRHYTAPQYINFSSENECRIALLLSGEGTGMIGPSRLPPNRPIGWFLPPEDEEALQLHGHVELWWFNFEWPDFEVTSLPSQMLRFSCFGKTRQTQRLKYVDESDAARMAEYYKFLQNAATRWELTGELEVMSTVAILIAFYTDLPEELSRTGGHRALQEFRQLLDERAFEDVSIQELATQVRMSPEHLRNLFAERFGTQPHTYRARLRMAKARQLLMEPKMNVKEVAHMVGYPDPLYFSRVFKQRYGVNPSEMIRKHRK